MTLAIVYSRASCGIKAPLVTVETHLSFGMARFNIVGLLETAVKESKDRVRSALMNAKFDFPDRAITVNLAPADLPKEGGRFDLPIALGILAASKQLPLDVFTQYEFTGELALSGELRAVRGILPVSLAATKAGRQIIVPQDNALEAALVDKAQVLPAKHLLEVCAHLKKEKIIIACSPPSFISSSKTLQDMAEVKGQLHAKRALEIAATGRHSLLFIGPPGTGKTMLASRLISILPPLSNQEALEAAAIASISTQGFKLPQWGHVPFRTPHHSSSAVALVGGGRPPKPGEISLAHNGILFLDELPEFNRQVLECLREPLESGCITISRAAYQTVFPAKFQLTAAMNPCPCGYAGSQDENCRCSPEQIRRYIHKISGPLLDRIDMQLQVPRISPNVLQKTSVEETSAIIRARVLAGREIQLTRQGKCNSSLSVAELTRYQRLSDPAAKLLAALTYQFRLSARSYHRLIKISRTIADLAKSEWIEEGHISEAAHFRHFDRMKSST